MFVEGGLYHAFGDSNALQSRSGGRLAFLLCFERFLLSGMFLFTVCSCSIGALLCHCICFKRSLYSQAPVHLVHLVWGDLPSVRCLLIPFENIPDPASQTAASDSLRREYLGDGSVL